MAVVADDGRGLAAISPGETQAVFDPGISKWFYAEYIGVKREPRELKHLSTSRKRK